MSELYLTLRRRLEVVTDWVEIGEDVMRQARHSKGLSMEAVSRMVHVSSKTYDRWEKRGAVPRQHVELVASALELGIERVPAGTIRLEPGTNGTAEERFEAALAELVGEVRALRRDVESRLPPQEADE